MNYSRIEVYSKSPQLLTDLITSAKDFFEITLESAYLDKLYWVESKEPIPLGQLKELGRRIFSDQVIESFRIEEQAQAPAPKEFDYVVELSYRAGVTDNVGNTATTALTLISSLKAKVYSGSIIYLKGRLTLEQTKKIGEEILGNPLLHKIKVFSRQNYLNRKRFADIPTMQHLMQKQTPEVHTIPLNRSDSELLYLSQKNCWSFSLAEIHHIQKFFKAPATRQIRQQKGLGYSPTDVEIEILAQTWSEHCKHKIFAAEIDYDGEKIDSLFQSYIKQATADIIKKRNIPWAISVFHDNAGIVRFDSHIDYSIKVETHNSPSALDPYGGALTGVLGVNRDILGVGLGSRPIANTNVFCVGDFSTASYRPLGTKHPRYILKGIHKGVEHAGNKSGIPTVNGAMHFHPNFSGKPLVFCGTVGVLPQNIGLPGAQKSSATKYTKIGDLIFVGGGAIGKDGIHGATFSSVELKDDAPTSAVQIGDPITQKKLSDFLLEARDLELFSGITDNGAGGLSSSIGEMALHTGGAFLDLAKNPVKYPGLSPYELMISEAQERMSFAVPPENKEDFLRLSHKHGVDVHELGSFTDSGYLEVFYNRERVAYLPLEFLHNSLPKLKLKASSASSSSSTFINSKRLPSWYPAPYKIPFTNEITEEFFEEALLKLLSRPNIQSKEILVRQYDHEVLAATHIKPFVGKSGHGPSDAGVIWAAPHGGEASKGIAIGCGLAYKISEYDCYQMALYAVDEAFRNIVAVGGDPDQVALVDNFCWPDPVVSEDNPDGEYKLAQLVDCCKGLYDLSCLYGAPLVSGKDSMKNDFIGKDPQGYTVKISVPPTLLITGLASVPHIHTTATSDFKKSGDHIYLLGDSYQSGLLGSEFFECFAIDDSEFNFKKLPPVLGEKNIALYRKLHQSITKGICSSVHDISDGGLIVAIIESMIGGKLGANIHLNLSSNSHNTNWIDFCFNEAPGRFVVSIPEVLKKEFQEHFSPDDYYYLGPVTESESLNLTIELPEDKQQFHAEIPLTLLQSYWGGFHV